MFKYDVWGHESLFSEEKLQIVSYKIYNIWTFLYIFVQTPLSSASVLFVSC